MSTRAETLATEFEARAAELTAVIEGSTDGDWKKVTAAEKWTVGVAAHHVAGGHEQIAGLVRTVASGQSVPNLTMAMIDEANARHAREHAGCTRAETLELHKRGAAAAAALIRGLSDAELDRTGTVLTGMPPMSAEQAIRRVLIGHVSGHLASIRATVGG
jgi:hypothetical protein